MLNYEDGRLVVTCADPREGALAIGQLLDANVGVLDVDASSVALEDVFAAYTNGGEVDIVHGKIPMIAAVVSRRC